MKMICNLTWKLIVQSGLVCDGVLGMERDCGKKGDCVTKQTTLPGECHVADDVGQVN